MLESTGYIQCGISPDSSLTHELRAQEAVNPLCRSKRCRLAILFRSLLILLPCPALAGGIQVNAGKYFDYYHMAFDLEPGKYAINKEYGFNDGGQFEVLVPKEYFPVPAPNCRKNIIIRMPWSENEEDKQQLFNTLSSTEKPVQVILELNPYVVVLNKEPLQLQLTLLQCFFQAPQRQLLSPAITRFKCIGTKLAAGCHSTHEYNGSLQHP